MESPLKNDLFSQLKSTLANNLRLRRLELNLTQEELASKASLATRHLQKLEHGEVNATLSTLSALAKALGTHPGDLLRE